MTDASIHSYRLFPVIAGLDPAIHSLRKKPCSKKVDARVEPAHDD